MTQDQINDLADDALNAACLAIQQKLGIESGDAAGLYFSGVDGGFAHQIFANYIKYELSFRKEAL